MIVESEESWWEFLELLRWGDEPICVHCEHHQYPGGVEQITAIRPELASGERLTGRGVARRYNLTVKSACRLLDVLEREDEHWGERVGAAAPAPRRDDFLAVFERFG